MSEEEKKAYEEAKLYLEHTGVDDFNLEKHQCENRKWAIETILKIVEKQLKEIEELNEIKQQICNEELITQDYVQDNFIAKDKIRKILQIEGNVDIETYLKTIVAENNRLENIEDDRDCNYISKDKIREVIGTPYPEIAIDNLLKLLEE